MMEIDHPQPQVAQFAHRFPRQQYAVRPIIGQHDPPRRQRLAQPLGRRGAIIIPGPARISFGHIEQALFAHVGNDRVQPGLLVLQRRIGITRHHRVVRADGLLETLGKVQLAALHRHPRCWIFHHRSAVVQARCEIVPKAQRMAELMRRQQRLAQQHHVALALRHGGELAVHQRSIRHRHAAAIARQAAGIGIPIIAHGANAVAVHPHLGAQYLTGARIAIGSAG